VQEYSCDVLVIGGGGAALRAALAIVEKEPSARVILTTKGKLGKSGVTATACSDRMAFHVTLPFTEPQGEDNWKFHADDIYRMGGYVSDEDLAQILARNSGEAFEYLDSLGVPWIKKGGRPEQFVTDGSKYARACYTGSYTANHIEETLIERIRTRPVKILEDIMVVDLIVSPPKDRVIGAFGLDIKDNLILFKAKATILATGGAGEVFKINVYPYGMTGDGYAMAYRAGVELVNMEFIQVGLSSAKTKLACSGSMMRALPRLVNDESKEFLSGYFPRTTSSKEIYLTLFQKGASWPVSFEHKSHLIDIAVFKELRKGRKVYLDYSRNPQNLKWENLSEIIDWYKGVKGVNLSKNRELKKSPLFRLQKINPQAVSWLEARGINLVKGDKIEIAPAAQHFQGGVKIGKEGETTLKGLYAAGECAGGQHGANRPGGNALLDSQVFGKIAGHYALEEAQRMENFIDIDSSSIKDMENKIGRLKNSKKGKSASSVRGEIQKITSDFVSIVKTEKGLQEGIKRLEQLEKEGLYSEEGNLVFALETLNMLKVAQMVIGAARMRKESRGPHLYFDSFDDAEPLPRNDESWRKYIVITKERDTPSPFPLPHGERIKERGNIKIPMRRDRMEFEIREPAKL